VVQTSDSKEPSPEELLRQRRLSANLIDGEESRPPSDQASASSEPSQGGDLQQKMQPLRLQAAMAGKLGDRHYLLTQGGSDPKPPTFPIMYKISTQHLLCCIFYC
jgi:hypothetical protein